jgi:hypothetical protein
MSTINFFGNVEKTTQNEFAVVSIMKNTQEWILNKWINHYKNLNFDIYICEDEGSNLNYSEYVENNFTNCSGIYVCKISKEVKETLTKQYYAF